MNKLTEITSDFSQKTGCTGKTEQFEEPKLEVATIELETIMNGEDEMYGKIIFTKKGKEANAIYCRKIANADIMNLLDNMPLARLIEKAAVDQGYTFYLKHGIMFGTCGAIAIIVSNEKQPCNKFSRFVTDLDKHISTYLSI